MWMRQHKSLVMAVGIGASAFMLVLIAVMPIYRNASEILGKIKIKSSELESLNNKVSILSKLDPAILQDRVTVLDRALPPQKDVLLYLTSIDGLSRELGLTFGGLSLTPGDITQSTSSATKAPMKLTGVQSLETQIKINGRQESLYTFLRTIEGVLPLMQIKDVKVSILGSDQYALALTLGMLWAEPVTLDIRGPVTLFNAEEDRYFAQLGEYRQFASELVAPSGGIGKTDLFAPYSSSIINQPAISTTPEVDPNEEIAEEVPVEPSQVDETTLNESDESLN